MHGVDQQLLLPRALGISPRSRALEYRVAPQEAEAAARRLAADGVRDSARPLIGFVIESFPTKTYRDWLPDQFAQLAGHILRRFPAAHFLLFGGALPHAKIEPLRAALGSRLTVYAGKLTLRETAALIARLDLYVGVDTGPSHLAGALRVPMVALYHCLHPSRVLAPPEHSRLTAIDHPAADTPACNEQMSVADVTVGRVWQAAEELLAASRVAAPA
jgi:heptosyltransferase-3